MLAVQFLEPGPEINELSPTKVKECLQDTLALLPVDIVIVGWDLPQKLVDVCAQETSRVGVQLYLWHPLLTGNGGLNPTAQRQVIGMDGKAVEGYRHMPEFTFMCPNNVLVARAVLDRLRKALWNGPYQGVFLDRIRFPSPSVDLSKTLACFCPDCRKVAESEGLDLVALTYRFSRLFESPDLIKPALQRLLAPARTRDAYTDPTMLRRFLDVRARSITRIVASASVIAQEIGIKVGLDCLSPALTTLVGQDLAGLDTCCDWIKIMVYGHTNAPAGLPYELLSLAHWLSGKAKISENEALRWLNETAILPMPVSAGELRENGLDSVALGIEVKRAHDAGVRKVLAGIELVDLEGVTHLSQEQIAKDLRALMDAKADGIVLAWDLWWMPPEWLKVVGAFIH